LFPPNYNKYCHSKLLSQHNYFSQQNRVNIIPSTNSHQKWDFE
jgi:hypothetical protein